MKSNLRTIFAGLFIILAFVQCEDAISPLTEEPQQKQHLSQTQLLTPENGSTESTSLAFSWSEVEDAESYEIQLSTNESFSSPLVSGSSDSVNFNVTELPGETTIFWKVRPVVQDIKGPWSEVYTFTTIASSGDSEPVTTAPQSPEDDAAEVPTNVKLQWTTVASATAYNLQIATDESFTSVVMEQIVEQASFKPQLSTETTYFWRVKPVVEGKEAEWSTPFSFTTGTHSVSSVNLISPSDEAADQPTTLTLEWEEIASMDIYQVQVATDESFSSPVVDEMVSETLYKVSELEPNETYFWRVQVAADESNANWSAVRTFSTEGGTDNPPSKVPNGFVSVANSDFVLNGETFRFAGTNAYYLHAYENINPQFVTNTLNAFEDAGISVIRMWGFYDGYVCGYSAKDPNENVIQTGPGEYSEEALRELDRVIAKAKERGIKIILTLSNYWDDLGGVCAYNKWDNASNPSKNMHHFINDPDTQRWFRNYIEMLLNRTNTVTGVKYKNEPAIFSWEIMNEGHYDREGSDPTALRDWYQEIAQYIKSIDPNHLVSTGEEGKEVGMDNASSPYSVDQYTNTYVLRSNIGSSFKANTAIPEIDYATAHWYPKAWGFGSSASASVLNAQRAWISDHINISEELGKPFVLGEYGFEGSNKTEVYNRLWDQAESVELDGSLIWQYTTSGYKCNENSGNICIGKNASLENSFKQHIQVINNSH